MSRKWSVLVVSAGAVVAGAVLLWAACVGAAEAKAEKTAEKQTGTVTIDFERARQLRQKKRAGQELTAAEEKYLDEAIRQKQALRPRQRGPAQATRPSTGLIALTDMNTGQKYKDQDGGLYGQGRNVPPEKHKAAAMSELAKIRPLDAAGAPGDGGKIVLISVGMSNTTQEFSRFKQIADADKRKSARVVIVDCAQGGCDAADWVDPNSRRHATVWPTVDQRLKAAGVSAQQVQVAWLKQARRGPANYGEFPNHAKEFQGHLAAVANRLRQKFPNLRILYLSSRIYAGYAGTALNPEPYAYESAFAVRWLIQDQINGAKELNYDPQRGKVTAPLLLWGPYLWADGLNGRKGDDLIYKREDLAGDGTHPSGTGRQKVATMLLEFFKTDPLARTWFLEPKASEAASSGE